MKICVYCASSPKINSIYFDATEKLARLFLKENIEIVYGGGGIGLMGKLADVIVEGGGKIKGIMPHFMNKLEWGHKKVPQFEFVNTMHERKAQFLVGTDAIVTLAGGSGTLEELLEVITLKRLGLLDKPIVILNTNNFYAPLKEMLENCVKENFMHPKHLDMWTFVNEPEDVLPAIHSQKKWEKEVINFSRNT